MFSVRLMLLFVVIASISDLQAQMQQSTYNSINHVDTVHLINKKPGGWLIGVLQHLQHK